MTIVYAHRGGAALRPENTITAFDHGFACGAEGLEFDVHLSKDGEVVIHHDDRLERTTNGRGLVRAHTAAELARLDAGYHFRDGSGGFPYRGHGVGVPMLRDVLRRYPAAPLIIELKVGGTALAQRVVDELRDASAVDRTAIGSFYSDAIHAVRACEPSLATGATKEETRWALYRSWVGWPLGAATYRDFQVPMRSGITPIVTRRFVTYARRAGIAVKVWTVNDAAQMRRLVEWGVAGLITDRPDLARTVVGAPAT
ncbi:MAG TPA: glycerophosphodiester phosphodiesterase [Vicinamibacterales bacterium]|nr:glycerophosphodiester phosphodiesterase [Vicinamibacterales bacterium]